jgi:hypothetical protein
LSDDAILQLGGLLISIMGYQYPSNDDLWDGNWRVVRAELAAPRCRVERVGPFVRTTELAGFAEDQSSFSRLETESAKLDCLEASFSISGAREGSLGVMRFGVSLTPNIANQTHHVSFVGDISERTTLLEDIKRVNRHYRVWGERDA